jgi:hypothetical protein
MKSCPVIVTEGEEAANDHSTASGKIKSEKKNAWRSRRQDQSKWRRSIEDKGHLSDNAEADGVTEGALHRRSESEDDH